MYYEVYGSGDPATKELSEEMTKRGVPHLNRDIRTSDVETGKRSYLVLLIEKGLKTIPQVFNSDGQHIGDYDTMMRILSKNQNLITA